MDIKSLETIIAICDTGSFGEAAEQVNLSPSAVSLRVRSLEKQLGLSLFDRNHRSPVLNTEGHAFVQRARIVYDSWNKLIEDFKPAHPYESLRLGAVPTSLLSTVPSAMKELQETVPGLHIKLTTGLSDYLGEMVLRGELDCAVVSQAISLNAELRYREIEKQPLVVIASKSLLGETDIELLENTSYIRFNKHTWAGGHIEKQLSMRKINLDITMEVDTLDGICALVANGVGVSVVPQMAILESFSNRIKTLPFGNPPVYRTIGLLEAKINRSREVTDTLYKTLTNLKITASE